ncbi:MAG: insulinase family protein, partial [Treponema sp.]|nr:insulinase family protein [Treponema sp.]
LPNGLRYYILENKRPENRAYLTLAVNAGSVLETDDERGLAHFVEHMAFNGTTRFPEAELLDYLRSLGMRFGADVNAHTSYDETVYGIEVPTAMEGGVKSIPEKALAIIDDWTYAVSFNPQDVEEERAIIMEEYRSGLGAMERIRQKLLPILFVESPYAERSPIGLPEIIQNAPAERLKDFYQKWYQSDNMALIIVGDFDGAALEAELATRFSMPKPQTPTLRPQYDLPAPSKLKTLRIDVFTDPELSFTQVALYYKRTPKKVGSTLAAFRELVIDNLIADMLDNRFDDAAALPQTPYIGAGAGSLRYGASSRFYVMLAHPKTGNVEESLRALLLEQQSLSRYGFTDAEIDRAKRAFVSSLERMNSERDRLESRSYVQQFTSHFLTGEMVSDIAWDLETTQTLLPGITARDIGNAARSYFADGNLSVFVLAPDSELPSLPSQSAMRRLVFQTSRTHIEPPATQALSEEFLDEEPSAGSILSERLDEETGAYLLELSNGARVILKETTNKNNEIILYAQARGGITNAATEQIINARLYSEMLNASGMGPYTRQELVKKLAGKQVALSFGNSAYLRVVNGSATASDLRTLFELLYLGFTQPRIDADTVQVMLDQYRTSLAQRRENPRVFFSDELTKVWNGNSPYFMPLEPADLERVNRDAALAFARRSLNPADYTFVFTGNLDRVALSEYIETYLASIPADGERVNDWATVPITRPAGLERSVYKGKEEQSLVCLGYFHDEPHTDAGGAAAEALTEYLDIVLNQEIREKLGGVYSIYANVSLSPLPPGGELYLEVFFGCDPARVPELIAAVKAQLARIAAGAIDADTFTKSIEALKKGLETNLQSNRYLAQSYANSAVIYQSSLNRLNKRPLMYGAVTTGDMQALAARLLEREPAHVVLYPENRKDR